MLQQFLTLSLLTTVAAMSPASSQGIPRGSCIDCAHASAPATKVVVSTPYPANSADSASAVAIGIALRDKLAKELGSEWLVVSRIDMNRDLAQSGYSSDPLLPYDQARQLASHLGGRVVVTTALGKGADGRYLASSLVRGSVDDAGQLVRLTQAPGQRENDFGSKLADQVAVVFKAYSDAKVCNDQQTTNQKKALEAANKALKTVPNFGYAEYCIALIAQQSDSASDLALQHFKNAVIGDPLSLKAVNQLAMIHQRRHDSTAVVADFQQMITIAPTNRKLADAAVNVFRQYNRPDAADQVVNQQMELDPTSPEWPDLKGNSCAAAAAGESDTAKARPKFECAYSAFSQEYTLDPTRADSLFFEKIIFVAQNQADSLTWARRFVEKFPSSATPLEIEAGIYASSGQVDSAIAVVDRIMKIDPTATKSLLVVTQGLLASHREDAALQFLPAIKASSDSTLKNQYSGLLINTLQTLAQAQPRNDSLLVELGQAVIDVAPTAPNYVMYANYFMAVGLADNLGPMATALRSAKTCDAAKAEDALITRLEPALTVAATSSIEGIKTFANGLITNLPPEKTFVAGMLKEACK